MVAVAGRAVEVVGADVQAPRAHGEDEREEGPVVRRRTRLPVSAPRRDCHAHAQARPVRLAAAPGLPGMDGDPNRLAQPRLKLGPVSPMFISSLIATTSSRRSWRAWRPSVAPFLQHALRLRAPHVVIERVARTSATSERRCWRSRSTSADGSPTVQSDNQTYTTLNPYFRVSTSSAAYTENRTPSRRNVPAEQGRPLRTERQPPRRQSALRGDRLGAAADRRRC